MHERLHYIYIYWLQCAHFKSNYAHCTLHIRNVSPVTLNAQHSMVPVSSASVRNLLRCQRVDVVLSAQQTLTIFTLAKQQTSSPLSIPYIPRLFPAAPMLDVRPSGSQLSIFLTTSIDNVGRHFVVRSLNWQRLPFHAI